MPQPTPIQELHWRSMTALVENIKSPATFLKDMLWGRESNETTNIIEFDLKTRARLAAPLVHRDADSLLIGSQGTTRAAVSPANIALKKAFRPSPLLYGRRAGTAIYPTSQDITSNARAFIAEEMQELADMVTNTEEILCAQALQGTISYQNLDEEVFTCTFTRSAGTIITLSTFWNDATPANVDFHANIRAVKKVMIDLQSLTPTDAIMGSEAADAFIRLVQAKRVVGFLDSNSGQVSVGDVNFAAQYTDAGVMFHGVVDGIKFWEYRTQVGLNGAAVDLIRAKYVEFISRSPRSDRVMYYGPINDMTALLGNNFVSKRFSKSWTQEDPSAVFYNLKTNPLPVPRRPDATVSVKVVSG